MQKILIAAGIILIIIGVFWKWIKLIPLFRLPGDIVIDKPGVKVFIPIVSMIIISVLGSIILYIIRKYF